MSVNTDGSSMPCSSVRMPKSGDSTSTYGTSVSPDQRSFINIEMDHSEEAKIETLFETKDESNKMTNTSVSCVTDESSKKRQEIVVDIIQMRGETMIGVHCHAKSGSILSRKIMTSRVR